MNKRYEVWMEKPFSFNEAYAEFRGHRFMVSEAKEYAGEWILKPKTKDVDPEKAKRVVNQRILKSGKNKGRTMLFLEGRAGRTFRAAGIPQFAPKTKIVINAWAVWPDWSRSRDMSSLQKLTEDAFQNGKFIPNDSYLLWRNKNFQMKPGIHGLKLEIYELDESDIPAIYEKEG